MNHTINITLFFLAFALSSAAKNNADYTITNVECQKMDGFGASDAWSFWKIGTWEDSLQTKVADWLFSTEKQSDGSPKGIGLSIWRFNAGTGSAEQGDSAKIARDTRTDYYQKQTGQRRFLKLAKERGVPTFLAFFNSPPVDYTINGLGTNTGRGGTLNLRDDCYDDFARYSADMIETIEKEDGVKFDYLCPVNEPDGHWNWQGPKQEGTPATNREIARLAKVFSKEFYSRNIQTKILVNESSDYRCMFGEYMAGWQRGNEIQCFWNPDSTDTYIGDLPCIAPIMAGHSYWTNTPVHQTDSQDNSLIGFRKRLDNEFNKLPKRPAFWMTETCIMANDKEIHGGGGFDFTMDVALYVARIMHYDITVANAQSWQWWRAAGGNYKDGLIRMFRHDVKDSKLMWTMGNFSYFVRPDAVRLEVKGHMNPYGIMMSAYKNNDGSIVVVAINYSKNDKEVCIGKNTADMYRTSDADGENLKYMGNVNMGNVQLKARSVTTFVMKSDK